MSLRTVICLAGLSLFTAVACGGGSGLSGGTADTSGSTGGEGAAPSVALSASPDSVVAGASTTLEWQVSNASSCRAGGGWSGQRDAAGGTAQVGPLNVDTLFTLSCDGPGGSAEDRLTVNVTPPAGTSGTITGAVDSSLVDRRGSNAIYVFAGSVTPDDVDGTAAEPTVILPVDEASNACTWSYASGSLPAGRYTLALTTRAGDDDPSRSDDLAFTHTATVDLPAGSLRHDLDAANVLHVGPTRSIKTLQAASTAASNGDVIEVDAGTYQDDIAVWRQNDLTVRGVGGRAHMEATREIPYDGSDQGNGQGIWVVKGSGFTAESIEFSGAAVPDQNGAGIRNQGADFTVCNGYFHDNENGILGGAYGRGMLIEHTEFDHNGLGETGRTHNIYVDGGGGSLIFRYNYSHHAVIGHNLKTRAPVNYILYNRIMDENSGTASYQVDVPNGGLTYLVGNVIQQGPNGDNSTMVSYGAEGLSSGRTHDLFVSHNTLVNDRGSGQFFSVAGGTAQVVLVDNILAGGGSVGAGGATQTSNLVTTGDPGFANRTGFDYHLTSSATGAIDQAASAGNGDGYSLEPDAEYVHPVGRRDRTTAGAAPDIGAFERTP